MRQAASQCARESGSQGWPAGMPGTARSAVPHYGAVAQTRIREYRLSRGMTIRELAAAAQISVGLISQVERGVADPSLETMRKWALAAQRLSWAP